jgi:hypothetical protein
MKNTPLTAVVLAFLLLVAQASLPVSAHAQVPGLINYQGRVVDAGTNFTGTGQFEFALVNAAGTTNYWSNDGTAAGQPSAAVSLTVTKGLYSVLLGDTAIANMSVALSPAVFTNSDVRLRVFFNDGITGFQQLAPDQRLGAVGYALNAASLATPAGGDLSGPVTNLTVTGLQGVPLAVPAPSTGQVLRYNGISWTNSAIQSGDLPSINSVSNFTGSLVGDVTGTQGATVVGTVGGVSAANVASGANAANNATSANTASTIVERDGSGNINVGTVTGALNGNATTATSATTAGSATTAASATTATSFSGSLVGNVIGTQGATVVSTVGGVNATNVASGANAANNATSANIVSTIVKRDGSGNIFVGTVSGALNGNATSATYAILAGTSTNFSGSLHGDVTGTQGATVIAAGAVTSAKIASGAVGPTQLAGTVVTNNASGVTLSGNLNGTNGLVIQTISGSDPASPAVGQMWLRTDL